MLEGTRGVTQGDAGQAPGGARGKLGAEVTGCAGTETRGTRGQRSSGGGQSGEGLSPGAAVATLQRGLYRPGCQASAGSWGRAGGRGGGARGGGLAPERRGVGAIKMHPTELPMEKDGTETQQPEEVVNAEEDAQEAAAAGK